MSVAEVLAEIEALPETERVTVAKETLRHLNADDLKAVERALRRLAHPDVPEDVWDGFEDAEDGRFVDPALIIKEEAPNEKSSVQK
jgi:hypothetical protein